jgi:hypothetical protein
VASIGAGAIHATAVGVHGEHRQAAIAFVLVAAFQLGWGVLALLRSQPWLNLVGAAGNAAALGGWIMAKTNGISFVNGLEEAEDAEFADALGAGLASVAIVAALVGLVGGFAWARRPQPAILGVAVLGVLGLAVPAMVDAGGHSHAGGHGDEAAAGHDDHGEAGHDDHGEAGHGEAGHDEGSGDHSDHGTAAMAPEPYDGSLPVDFSGTPGITPEQQEEAEELATNTIERLPQFADTETAYDEGYRSIGDAGTGVEHYLNWELINDDTYLDPDAPESLVYRVDGEERTLVAAMFMLTDDDTLDNVPDIGGDLIQWHVHDDLCFSGDENAWVVSGVAPPPQECPSGTFRLGQAPMIHVWITSHPCGAFAALEGIGGGQIAEGEERACDDAHGDPDADVGEGGPPEDEETAQGS